MEKAYLITYNSDLQKLKNNLSEYDRIYFGDSYCEYNLFYFLDDNLFLDTIFSFGKPVTLTTPLISNKNIDKLIHFIEKIQNLQGLEIVINDYGVFYSIKLKFPNIKLIFGNFLSGQSKDPFLKVFKDKDIHKKLTIDNDFYSDFFHKNNIGFAEIYNVFQGLELNNNFDLTLYFPFVVYSTTRYCHTKLISNKKNYLTVIEDCEGCKNNTHNNFKMDLKIGEDLSDNYLIGNKQFYRNEILIKHPNIKRIVYNYDLLG